MNESGEVCRIFERLETVACGCPRKGKRLARYPYERLADLLNYFGYPCQQSGVVQWFGKEINGPCTRYSGNDVGRCVRCNEDYRNPPSMPGKAVQKRKTVHFRHLQVCDDQAEVRLAEFGEQIVAASIRTHSPTA